MDLITKISLIDQEAGLKWIRQFQGIIKKLAVTRNDVETFNEDD